MLDPHEDLLTDYMPLLRGASIGAFRSLKDDPPFREVPLRLGSVDLAEAKWEAGMVRTSSSNAWMIFELPEEPPSMGVASGRDTRPRMVRFHTSGHLWKTENQKSSPDVQSTRSLPTARPIGRNQIGRPDRLRNTKRFARPSVLPSLTILLKKQDFRD